jgi:ABC-type multidrug transport system ATPase subunit
VSILEARELRRSFTTTTGVLRRQRKTVEAVRGVSFAVERGELFGLLGPNGAGKTTTIKMLITLLLPTSGSATILLASTSSMVIGLPKKAASGLNCALARWSTAIFAKARAS